MPLTNELWALYCDAATPQAVTRLALRYINHIQLPWPDVDFDLFLRAGPVVPSELPQFVPAFNLQVLIADTENEIAANVIQRLESSLKDERNTVVLDIDAFKAVDLLPDDPVIDSCFARLRDFKNQIFFNYLTDDALRRYE
jgi:uncharacterized protein (TIGR04255 family)